MMAGSSLQAFGGGSKQRVSQPAGGGPPGLRGRRRRGRNTAALARSHRHSPFTHLHQPSAPVHAPVDAVLPIHNEVKMLLERVPRARARVEVIWRLEPVPAGVLRRRQRRGGAVRQRAVRGRQAPQTGSAAERSAGQPSAAQRTPGRASRGRPSSCSRGSEGHRGASAGAEQDAAAWAAHGEAPSRRNRRQAAGARGRQADALPGEDEDDAEAALGGVGHHLVQRLQCHLIVLTCGTGEEGRGRGDGRGQRGPWRRPRAGACRAAAAMQALAQAARAFRHLDGQLRRDAGGKDAAAGREGQRGNGAASGREPLLRRPAARAPAAAGPCGVQAGGGARCLTAAR